MSDYKVTNLVGIPTDYSDRNNWAYLPEKTDKEADTFFIYPTVYVNTAPDAPAIVPVEDEMLRAGVKVFFAQGPQAFVDLTNLYICSSQSLYFTGTDDIFLLLCLTPGCKPILRQPW